jgi:hypothetical protein
MRSVLRRSALAATVAASVACTARPSSDAAPAGSSDVITYEELERHRFTDVYEAVQALHSNWLIPRGTDSFRTPSQVTVVYDDTHLGDVSTLRTINIKSVVYIQYFSGVDATARWGLDHGAGVIFVSSRNSPRGRRARPDTGSVR